MQKSKFRIEWSGYFTSGNKRYAHLAETGEKTPEILCRGDTIIEAYNLKSAIELWKSAFPGDRIRVIPI